MKKFFLLLVVMCLPLLAGAENLSPDSSSVAGQFDAANKLYAQSKFADAAAAYEQIIATGSVSPALYFNLGNAHFKAGQIGSAIAAYRQAERLSPRDPDLRANLRFAQNRVTGPTLKDSASQRWLSALSLNEWAWLGGAGVWFTFGLLIARQVKPALAPVLRSWIWLSAAGTVILFICLALGLSQTSPSRVAIVTVTDATVRTSPLDEAPSSFTAHDGATLRVLDQKDDWLQVTDDARQLGWVKRSAVNWSPKS